MFPISYLLLYPQSALMVMVSLVPAFFLTSLIEYHTLRPLVLTGHVWRATAAANIVSYGFIALVLWMAGVEAEETPLVSADVYAINLSGCVTASGEWERVEWMIRQIQALNLGTQTHRTFWLRPYQPGSHGYLERSGYFPWAERRIAEGLHRHSHTAQAIVVLRQTLEIPHLRDADMERTRARIEELEASLASEERAAELQLALEAARATARQSTVEITWDGPVPAPANDPSP